ncbi:hypothetical protein [uncultured Sphaerochaeta sp.]|uniref:hypothetical protein n=1 Tax=uncultured Sphaerochaeta sp. TaxID=886478 RepID=UPI002A0A73F9|nr:hypothetical protein [uncultured Sphaerochaeta sp.]
MTKKYIFFASLFFFCGELLFAFNGQVSQKFPNQVKINWDEEKGAEHYDIYLGKEPLKRLGPTEFSTMVGSNETPLRSCSDYQVLVVARGAEDAVLSYVWIPFSTTGWSGSYQWKNSTKYDNHGKCKELGLVVFDESGNLRVYGDFKDKGLLLLFPLLPFAQEYPKIFYQDSSPAAVAYRVNAEIFNTTSMEPEAWKLQAMEVTISGVSSKVVSFVAGMSFLTETTFSFYVSKEGKKQVVLHTWGKGIASWGLFACPDKGSGGDYVFTCEDPLD